MEINESAVKSAAGVINNYVFEYARVQEAALLQGYIARWRRFSARNQGRISSSAWNFAVGRMFANPRFRHVYTALIPKPREPRDWTFLVGCYNSGTTILREILDAHQSVSSLPREGVRLTDAFPDLQADGWVRMLLAHQDQWQMPEDRMRYLADRAKRDWGPLWSRKAEIFLEKSIAHSVRMRWLEQAFDHPRFIVIRRNGYCVCEGIRRRASPRDKAREQIGDTYPMRLLAEQWVAINETIDDALPHLKHTHVVHYENLVTQPLDTIAGIYDFLGLDRGQMVMRDGVLHSNGRPFAIQNMNPSSLARLSVKDCENAAPILSPLFEKYGYNV